MQGDAGIEQTYYAAAETEYGNNNWSKAADGFTKYLSQFPNGNMATSARYYRGESYYQLKDYSKALTDYDAVANGGWSDFTDEASLPFRRNSRCSKKITPPPGSTILHQSGVAMDTTNLQKAVGAIEIFSQKKSLMPKRMLMPIPSSVFLK